MKIYSLGPLEREVMSCLWDIDGRSVREIHECLGKKRTIAYTTIMTIMTRLVDKGFLKRKKTGKAYIYTLKQTKKQTAKNMIERMFSSLVDQFGEEAVIAFSDELVRKKVGK